MRRIVIAAITVGFASTLVMGAPRDTKKPPKNGSGSAAGSAAGSGSATPPSEPAPDSGSNAPPPSPPPTEPDKQGSGSAAPAEPAGPDVDSLRPEYLSLRDEMFKSRANANAVASQLYSSRVPVHLAWTTGRTYGVTKASIRLDGATIYEDATGAVDKDDGVRFDGYIATGRHVMTFHFEAIGKDDDSFTSTTESTLVIKAAQDKDLQVLAKARDAGDIAFGWKKGEHGSYQLGLDVAVKAVPHGTQDKARTK